MLSLSSRRSDRGQALLSGVPGQGSQQGPVLDGPGQPVRHARSRDVLRRSMQLCAQALRVWPDQGHLEPAVDCPLQVVELVVAGRLGETCDPPLAR